MNFKAKKICGNVTRGMSALVIIVMLTRFLTSKNAKNELPNSTLSAASATSLNTDDEDDLQTNIVRSEIAHHQVKTTKGCAVDPPSDPWFPQVHYPTIFAPIYNMDQQ